MAIQINTCLTNLLDFYNDIFNNYDEAKAVEVIYVDFQKSFYKISHKRLLKTFGNMVKLEKFSKAPRLGF